MIWVVNSDDWAIFKVNPKDGTVVEKIQLDKSDPALHGLDIDSNGVLWYSDADSGWICKLV
jgi:streptogramin lyase